MGRTESNLSDGAAFGIPCQDSRINGAAKGNWGQAGGRGHFRTMLVEFFTPIVISVNFFWYRAIFDGLQLCKEKNWLCIAFEVCLILWLIYPGKTLIGQHCCGGNCMWSCSKQCFYFSTICSYYYLFTKS